MVFTTSSKIFTKNKQFVCLAMRQSLRNLFDLLQKHEELKRDEYEANRRYDLNKQENKCQIVSVGTNRVIIPGYMEMNDPKYFLINNVKNNDKNYIFIMWVSCIKIILSFVKRFNI